MALYDDITFLNRLAYKLDKFKETHKHVWNFRCPICGDSKKDPHKARGYIYARQDRLVFKCHNCSEALTFAGLLQSTDPLLYEEYRTSLYVPNRRTAPKPAEPEKPKRLHGDKIFYEVCKRCSDLPPTHEARKYLLARHVQDHNGVYFVERGGDLAQANPSRYEGIRKIDRGYIVFPYFYRNSLGGWSVAKVKARCLGEVDRKYRYLSISFSDVEGHLPYGGHRIDPNDTDNIYVVEGEIDSLMLPNAVARGSSDLYNVATCLPPGTDNRRLVFIYDNEGRNKEIRRNMERTQKGGYRIFRWPKDIPVHVAKDLNDVIANGLYDREGLLELVKRNSAAGLMAELVS